MHKAGGGLNWGMRPSRKNKDEAYIPLPRHIYRQKPAFFPRLTQHFLVETDDGEAFFFVMVHPKTKGGSVPGGIATPENNAELGQYFRRRLMVPYGAMVEKEDLLSYGRTDVSFTKHSDEDYYMDFSVQK